jgi:hypothetical protein
MTSGETMTKQMRVYALTAVVALTVSLTGTALANHQFTDVADDAFFADSIEAISSAGCATGFDDGTFRTRDSITRGQFAFWLTNCGGRVERDEGPNVLDTDNQAETIAAAQIEPGTQDNGDQQIVAVVASYEVVTGADDLPCSITFELSESGGGLGAPAEQQVVQIPFNSARLVEFGTGSMTMLVPVDAGHESTLTLEATRAAQGGCASNITASGSVLAMSFPFNGFALPPG